MEYNKQGVENIHKFASQTKEGTALFIRGLLSVMPGNTVGKLAEIINQGEDYEEYKWVKECVNEMHDIVQGVENARSDNDRSENVRNENVSSGNQNLASPHQDNGWEGAFTPPPPAAAGAADSAGSYRNAARRGVNFAGSGKNYSQDGNQSAINRQPGLQGATNRQPGRSSSHASYGYQSRDRVTSLGNNIHMGNTNREQVSTNNTNNINQRNISDAESREGNNGERQHATGQRIAARNSMATSTADGRTRTRSDTEEDVNNRINRRAEHLANERMYDLQRKKNIIISNLYDDMGDGDKQLVEDILSILGCGHLLYYIVSTERI